MSYNNPTFAPFRSGCGMCKPSTDYYAQTEHQSGGGNYSNDGLIPESTGKNFYEAKNYQLKLDNHFEKNNYGIDYATAFGGKKTKSKKQKGGVGEESVTGMSNDMLFPYNSSGGKGKGKGKGKKTQKGGVDEESITGMSNDMLAPYTIGGGKCKCEEKCICLKKGKCKCEGKCTCLKKGKGKKPVQKGGMESSGATPMDQRFFNPDATLDNYPEFSGNGIMSAYGKIESGDIGSGMLAPYTASTCNTANPNTSMQTGGKGKKTQKGGVDEESITGMSNDMLALYKIGGNKCNCKGKCTCLKKNKCKCKGKCTCKKSIQQKGGMESSGATSMNQRFFNPEATLDNYPEFSGNGIMSAYGKIESGDIGSGMLAPYTASKCDTANPNTSMQTGGKGKKTQKGGAHTNSIYVESESDHMTHNKMSGGKGKGKSKKTQKGGAHTNSIHVESESDHMTHGKMSGGKGSSYPSVYVESESDHMTHSKMSGGKKKMKGGDGPIPYIGNGMITSVQSSIDGAIDSFSQFMQQLDSDYLKSVQEVESIKIGNQRLIQGGYNKKYKKTSKETSVKKSKKPSVKKSKKRGGGNGSDWASSQGSRGPSNAPDDYWGVPGEEWFRQFNKTGDYIPNSQLAYAATPTLASDDVSSVVSGYDEMGFNYGTA